jgi:hypothetical protein
MIILFPIVLSLSKDASRPEPGFDRLSPNGIGPRK